MRENVNACRDFRNHVGGKKASVVVRRDVASEWSGEVLACQQMRVDRISIFESFSIVRGRNFSTVELTRRRGIPRQVLRVIGFFERMLFCTKN